MNIQALVTRAVSRPHNEGLGLLDYLTLAFAQREIEKSIQYTMEYWYSKSSLIITYQEFVSKKVEYFTALLQSKAKEYSLGKDRFSNFRMISTILNTSEDLAFWILPCKQVASLVECSAQERDDAYYDEKCGDIICYMILLYNYQTQSDSNGTYEASNG